MAHATSDRFRQFAEQIQHIAENEVRELHRLTALIGHARLNQLAQAIYLDVGLRINRLIQVKGVKK